MVYAARPDKPAFAKDISELTENFRDFANKRSMKASIAERTVRLPTDYIMRNSFLGQQGDVKNWSSVDFDFIPNCSDPKAQAQEMTQSMQDLTVQNIIRVPSLEISSEKLPDWYNARVQAPSPAVVRLLVDNGIDGETLL